MNTIMRGMGFRLGVENTAISGPEQCIRMGLVLSVLATQMGSMVSRNYIEALKSVTAAIGLFGFQRLEPQKVERTPECSIMRMCSSIRLGSLMKSSCHCPS